MTEDKKDKEMIHCEKLYLTKRKRVVKSTALNFTMPANILMLRPCGLHQRSSRLEYICETENCSFFTLGQSTLEPQMSTSAFLSTDSAGQASD